MNEGKKKTGVAQKVSDFFHDLAVCAIVGVCVALILSAVIALIAALATGFSTAGVGNAVRSGLLVAGALLLFVTAGLLMGRKGMEKIRNMAQWKKGIRFLGPSAVFLLVAVIILCFATFADYMVRQWI